MCEKWGKEVPGKSGYSGVGAVVGATYPEQLSELRAKLPHTFFEDPMACAPYSVNLMGARTRRHASAMDAVPHPLPSVMFPTVPGLSGVMPAKEIPLSDIVVWYTCPAIFPMGP